MGESSSQHFAWSSQPLYIKADFGFTFTMHTQSFRDLGKTELPSRVCGAKMHAAGHLEAGVEDELGKHELVRALDGGRNAPLQRHHAILVHIPASKDPRSLPHLGAHGAYRRPRLQTSPSSWAAGTRR